MVNDERFLTDCCEATITPSKYSDSFCCDSCGKRVDMPKAPYFIMTEETIWAEILGGHRMTFAKLGSPKDKVWITGALKSDIQSMGLVIYGSKNVHYNWYFLVDEEEAYHSEEYTKWARDLILYLNEVIKMFDGTYGYKNLIIAEEKTMMIRKIEEMIA